MWITLGVANCFHSKKKKNYKREKFLKFMLHICHNEFSGARTPIFSKFINST